METQKPLLLDLFCGAGGAAEGYARAGFKVIGVDIEPQPNYPFRFVQADAVTILALLVAGENGWLDRVVVVVCSPPCQRYSDLAKRNGNADEHPDLIPVVRALLERWGGPYVIENVEGAPLRNPVMLCGASPTFDGAGLRVIRHRLFESNVPLVGAPCPDRHPLVFTHDKRKAHYGKLDQDVAFVQVTGGVTPALVLGD